MNKRHWNPPALRFQWLHEKFMLAVARELCELNVPKESSALLRWGNYVEPRTRLPLRFPRHSSQIAIKRCFRAFFPSVAGRSKQCHDCEFIKWRKMHWKSLIENCKIDFIHSSQPTWTFCITLVHKSTFAYIRAFRNYRDRETKGEEKFSIFRNNILSFHFPTQISLSLAPPAPARRR